MGIDRVMHHFERLSLRARMAAGFAAVIAVMLLAGLGAVVSQRQAFNAIDRFLERNNRIAELTLNSNASLLKARRDETDFLLNVQRHGYEEARSRHSLAVVTQLALVRKNMAAVRALADDPEIEQGALKVEQASERYEKGFLRLVDLYGRLRQPHTGLESQLRARAKAIEDLLGRRQPEPLATALLALRRAENDFLRRGQLADAQSVDLAIAGYRRGVQAAKLPPPRKAELLDLGSDYQRLFRQYVVLSDEIRSARHAYLGTVQSMESMLKQLHEHRSMVTSSMRTALEQLARRSIWIFVGATLSTVLLGVGVAWLIARNVDRALQACLRFAGTLAGGDLSARLRTTGSAEFRMLGASLNRMADALETADHRQAEQAAELHRLNRALRVLSACNDALVHANSEHELLQAICRHAVEIGGYRLAWVGYARHDAGKSIEPVAHAGSDRDYVEQLNLSWGDDPQRCGVGGKAVRENQPVAAHHIPTDRNFTPWRVMAAQRGLMSCLALPLRSRGAPIGMLSIYAAEADAFDSEEIKVLQKLADDLAYGIGSRRDSEARQRAERELARRANTDGLTGLPNRVALETRLASSLAGVRQRNSKLALLSIDLDRFKNINESLGHSAGDRLLVEVARRLRNAVRKSDWLARISADEFMVLLRDVETADDAAAAAGKLLAALHVPVSLGEHEIRPIASIGVAIFPDDGGDAAALMMYADTAMQHAKTLGGGRYHFFDPQMNASVAGRFAMEADLRRALERNELLLHFQPQVDFTSGEMTGAEALVRWRHPQRGMVSPADFIPLAEETGLIEPLGEWVLRTVCEQLRAWREADLQVLPVAVNLSARQFRQPHLATLIEQALAQHGVHPRLLKLEITESAVMHDVASAVATVKRLKSLGLGVSLDDFGTGYSSLGYLKRFPIDQLKIDQSFVRDIATDPDSAAICNAIVGLAHSLGIQVIAEGVETQAQALFLQQHGCDEMQGYYFSRPLPAPEFTQLLVRDDGQRRADCGHAEAGEPLHLVRKAGT